MSVIGSGLRENAFPCTNVRRLSLFDAIPREVATTEFLNAFLEYAGPTLHELKLTLFHDLTALDAFGDHVVRFTVQLRRLTVNLALPSDSFTRIARSNPRLRRVATAWLILSARSLRIASTYEALLSTITAERKYLFYFRKMFISRPSSNFAFVRADSERLECVTNLHFTTPKGSKRHTRTYSFLATPSSYVFNYSTHLNKSNHKPLDALFSDLCVCQIAGARLLKCLPEVR